MLFEVTADIHDTLNFLVDGIVPAVEELSCHLLISVDKCLW